MNRTETLLRPRAAATVVQRSAGASHGMAVALTVFFACRDFAIRTQGTKSQMTNRHRATCVVLALLLCSASEISAQGQATTAKPPATTASEVAGIQATATDCPRVFLTTTWTLHESNRSQTTLSYGLVECGSTTAIIGGGLIPNADFTVTRTGAHLLTTTEHGVVNVTWQLDGESRYSTDGTTLYTARKGDTVKSVHHSDSLSAIVSGAIGGRTFSARAGYIAIGKDTITTRP